jgi:predicted nucleic acid-binding protein
MRQGEAVFVDSGAWIALALSRDPLHAQAREQWELLHGAGAKLHTSVPIFIETFTFLDRNANRDVALKTTVGVAQVKVRGLAKVQAVFSFAILAYNLVRIPKLLEAT